MITEEEKQAIAERLIGTSGVYDGSIEEEYKLDPGDLDEIASEAGVERCAECGWWCESSELEENDSGEPVCEDCSGC